MARELTEGERLRIMRLRTEIAFIRGDVAHGGPEREAELKTLREELAEPTEEK